MAVLAAWLALALSGIGSIARIVLAAIVLGTGFRAWSRQARWTGAMVRVWRDGTAEWRCSGESGERRGRLSGHWQAGPLVTLVLEAEGSARGRERLALWRDQVDPESWRRLLILVRHDRHGDGAID